jgi:hypothetical protein
MTMENLLQQPGVSVSDVESWWWHTPISSWHERYLPPPLNRVASLVLLHNVPFADEWLIGIILLLVTLAVVQTKALQRPAPVPLKRLPKRPCVSIQFQPDDPVTTNILMNQIITGNSNGGAMYNASNAAPVGSFSMGSNTPSNTLHQTSKKPSFIQRIDGMFRRTRKTSASHQRTNDIANHEHPLYSATRSVDTTAPHTNQHQHPTKNTDIVVETIVEKDELDFDDDEVFSMLGGGADSHSTSDPFTPETTPPVPPPPPPPPRPPNDYASVDPPFTRLEDLPDSFAPLLSSSYMSVLTHQLTANLIHAVQLEAGVRLRPGRHEIPLDKDHSRPQLVLDVPATTGCRMTVAAVVGSDGLSNEQDMQVERATTSRSQPMVKHAGLVLDPPLPLSNVAPTLIHFPTLFEDRNMIPILRSRQWVRFVVDFIVSMSSFLEKCLWILESQCRIHLSKVRITPLYKGTAVAAKMVVPSVLRQWETTADAPLPLPPEWRLQLAFSGHVLLFNWIPIPFISVTLPSFIIPQPHALLEFLLSS